MCGRYALIKLSAVLNHFPWIEQPPLFPEPKFNIAPSQSVAVVTNENDPPTVDFVRWGLVPSWAKDGSITAGSRMINARAETVAEKPAFKRLLKNQRCMIPADAFYEWKKNPGEKIKTPYCFQLKDKRPFAFAGLFDTWRSPDGNQLRTCTIITTAANQLLEPFHNRMPVILKDEHCRRWVGPGELPRDNIAEILAPYPADEMTAVPVSSSVNSVKNQGPELMQPATIAEAKPPFQPGLFPSS